MLRLRHALRPLSLPRLLVLALLVLGVLAKPVLASIGEVHELQHDPAGRHLHLDDDGRHLPVADDARADSEPTTTRPAGAPSDGDGLLHELLHFAHCCGQSPQSVPAVAATLPAAPGDTALATRTSVPAPRHHAHGVFRPPITG